MRALCIDAVRLYGAPATFLCDSVTLISACSSSSSLFVCRQKRVRYTKRSFLKS